MLATQESAAESCFLPLVLESSSVARVVTCILSRICNKETMNSRFLVGPYREPSAFVSSGSEAIALWFRRGPPHYLTFLITSSMEASMEVNIVPWRFVEASMEFSLLPWTLVEASMDVHGKSHWWWEWRLPLASINWTFHSHIWWKLPRASIYPCRLPPTCTRLLNFHWLP